MLDQMADIAHLLAAELLCSGITSANKTLATITVPRKAMAILSDEAMERLRYGSTPGPGCGIEELAITTRHGFEILIKADG